MIAIGFVVLAIAGVSLRALASSAEGDFNRHVGTTLALNVGGSFLLGWLHGADADTMLVFGVGGLGSLTTFSTFSGEVGCIGREATIVEASGLVAVTVLAGIAAAAIGYSF